jgi:hypothetical protein
MEDILQPILVILIGGLFAPLLTQLIERMLGDSSTSTSVAHEQTPDEKKSKRKRWVKFFAYAVAIQLLLFTMFFFASKWSYFDKNYFKTSERELIREGIKKDKPYVIPKMVIRLYSEHRNGVPFSDTLCAKGKINYCLLVSISYEIVALRDYNEQPIFQETYKALNAENVVREPGSEKEGNDKNPQKVICDYDIITSMKKFERRTITTRADFLYNALPETMTFMGQSITNKNWDFFYYPNNEDDVIGEVEFQVMSRTLKFNTPTQEDAKYINEDNKPFTYTPQLFISSGECLHYNILTTKIPRLKNTESFGIKWSWSK